MTTTSNGSPEERKAALLILDQRVVIRVKHLLGVIVVAFLIFGLIGWQVASLFEASRQGDLRDARDVAYQAELDTFLLATSQYESCQARIDIREINRQRFVSANATLRAVIDTFAEDGLDPRFLKVYEILDAELEAIISLMPPIDPSVCPEIPIRPAPTIRHGRQLR